MTSHQMKAIITRDDAELELDVEFGYSPGRPMQMYARNGDPGYPAEPAEIEITKASYVNAEGEPVVITLTEDEDEEVVAQIEENYDLWNPDADEDED